MYPRSSMNPKYKKYKEDYNKVNYNFTAQNQWPKDPKKSTKKKKLHVQRNKGKMRADFLIETMQQCKLKAMGQHLWSTERKTVKPLILYSTKRIFKSQREIKIFFQSEEFQNSSPAERTARNVKRSLLDRRKIIPDGNVSQ